MEPLRVELGLEAPYIVENGGGVFFPGSSAAVAPPGARTVDGMPCWTLGVEYAAVSAFLASHGGPLGMRGFGDMDDAEVAELTGLSLDAAQRARHREFTEPFTLTDESNLSEVDARAREAGLKTTTGGRLHHLMGAEQDKGRAVRLVTNLLAGSAGHPHDSGPHQQPSNEIVTIGLGDGPNDLPMLEAVTHAVVVPSPTRGPLEVAHPRCRVAPEEGPGGWSRALLDLLGELGAVRS